MVSGTGFEKEEGCMLVFSVYWLWYELLSNKTHIVNCNTHVKIFIVYYFTSLDILFHLIDLPGNLPEGP